MSRSGAGPHTADCRRYNDLYREVHPAAVRICICGAAGNPSPADLPSMRHILGKAYTLVAIRGNHEAAWVTITTNDRHDTGGASGPAVITREYLGDDMSALAAARIAAVELINRIPANHVLHVIINGEQVTIP